MLGISKFWHKDRQQASGRLLAHRPPTYYHHPYKIIIIRETKYDLKQILFGSLHIHLDYTFEGGNPSWKIDKVNLTSILSCSWYVCMQARTQGIFPTILPLKNVIDFGNFCPLLNYIQTFLIPLFFPFLERVYYRTLCQTPPQRETTHFLFENSSSDCSEQIRAAKNSFLGESKMVKKKTTEPPRLLKNRYAPSFPPNLLSITNLIGAAGDVLLLLLWCSCLPPPIFLYTRRCFCSALKYTDSAGCAELLE